MAAISGVAVALAFAAAALLPLAHRPAPTSGTAAGVTSATAAEVTAARRRLEAVRVPARLSARLDLYPARGSGAAFTDPDGRMPLRTPLEGAAPALKEIEGRVQDAGWLAGHVQILRRDRSLGVLSILVWTFSERAGAIDGYRAFRTLDGRAPWRDSRRADLAGYREQPGGSGFPPLYELVWVRGPFLFRISYGDSRLAADESRSLVRSLAYDIDRRAAPFYEAEGSLDQAEVGRQSTSFLN